jgi:O-acetyl-ADP-ribose deacetylase (regulator of RNase III)
MASSLTGPVSEESLSDANIQTKIESYNPAEKYSLQINGLSALTNAFQKMGDNEKKFLLTPITEDAQRSIFGLQDDTNKNNATTSLNQCVSMINTQYISTYTRAANQSEVLPSGSASIINLAEYQHWKTEDTKEFFINTDKNINFILQAAPGAATQADLKIFGASGLKNSVYNCLYLADKHDIEGIAFPIIGGSIFFSALKITKNQLYEYLLEGVEDYFKDFSSSKIKVVLFAEPKEKEGNDNFGETFNSFVASNKSSADKLKKNGDGSIFTSSKKYNDDDANTTKITALVNAANTELQFGGGLSDAFSKQINIVYPNLSGKIDDESNTMIRDFHSAYEKYYKKENSGTDIPARSPAATRSNKFTGTEPEKTPAPPPPPTEPAPSSEKPKVAFAEVLKELVGQLNDKGDTSVNFTTLGITSVKDNNFLYPTDGDAANKKSLNCDTPSIGDMIKGFESAETGDDTNFYLGACRSIQAAYQLEMEGITDGDTGADEAKMRAKLLLNLRKNSLLLKVPARWDYKEMKMGEKVEPELNPEEEQKLFLELQQKCAKFNIGSGSGSGTSDAYKTDEAYDLAKQLIPLDEKMEIDKLQKKIDLYEKYLPKNKIVYKSLIINPGFTCKIIQSGNNCGRAALANFFGDQNKFIKGFDDGTEDYMKNEIEKLSPYDLTQNRPDTINLGSICKLSQICESFTDGFEKEETTKCKTDEHYSIRVMVLTLHICGFYKFDIPSIINGDGNPEEKKKIDKKLMMCVANKYVVGFLILQNKSHWVNYKRVNIGSTDDLFYFINSGDCEDKTDNGSKLLTLIYDYHKNTNKITKVIPIIQTTDNTSELNKSQQKSILDFEEFKKNNTGMTDKELNYEFNNEYLPDANKEVTNIEIWEYNTSFNLDESKKTFTDNQNSYKWKLFMKEVTSEIQNDEAFKTDKNKLKVMFYLSSLPSDIIDVELKKRILNSSEPVKKNITRIFVDDTKDNYDKIKNSSDDTNFDITIIEKNNNYLSPVTTNSGGVTTFTPTFEAKDRFYYNLNNTNTYNKNIDTTKTDYRVFIDKLKKKVDSVLVSPEASPGGGGFKPRHNTITNHSKSRHNSSFKVSSSSKSKSKSHNRSHTQRVK